MGDYEDARAICSQLGSPYSWDISGRCANVHDGTALSISETLARAPPKPISITYLSLADLGDGRVWIDFGVANSGNVAVKIDGVTIWQGALNNTTKGIDFAVPQGNHNICVNDVCKSIFIASGGLGDAPPPPAPPAAPPTSNCVKEGDISLFNYCCSGLEASLSSGFKCVKSTTPPTTPPPSSDVPKESQPPAAQPCPRGNKYLASGSDIWLGCDVGYTRPQFGDYCVCEGSPEGQGEGLGLGLDSIGGLLKILPTLLMFSVIASIIGAFRK